jgi:hypothetical protein
VALVTVLSAAAVSLAAAHTGPLITFSISPNQTAGAPEHFTYAVRGATRKEKVVFQRQGAAGKWRTVTTLRNRSGNGVAPALTIGRYHVRLAVLKNGNRVAAQHRRIFVYGKVKLDALCNADNVRWQNTDGGCDPQTSQVGSFLFESEATFDAPGASNPNAPAINITISPSTSCRSLHLDYGESNADQQHAGGEMMITQTLIQKNTDPVTETFPGGTVQHTDFKLDHGPWQITDESTYTGEGSLKVLENGYLQCYTPNGVIPGS